MTEVSLEKTSKGRRIVVVDDDSAVRESTVTLLESAGHSVVAFESGTAFVAAGVPSEIDVILLDMVMPGLNGLDTLRALRAAERELPPVVVLTGHGDIPLAVEAMKLGAAEFLEKPYPMKDLLELVATLENGLTPSTDADPQRASAKDKVAQLTSRQREVLKGMAMGEPSKVTAHRLGLSVRTVEAYRGHLFGRLGVRGMAEAVRIAVLADLIES
ncbi:MAG TPA: response regulator [Sphingomicrobium sp.]|nr:response regulator [Sphingomicrobium sp.]